MIIWFAFLIPLVAIAVAVMFFKFRWWEPLALISAVVLTSFLGVYFSERSQTSATEYLGGWVTSASYYEPYNEYVSKTCSECTARDKNGSCTSTRNYDCSYCDEHSESYDYETTVGSGFFNAQDVWNTASAQFGETFVDMNRHSSCTFPRNGNKWEAVWNGDSATMLPYFAKHSYENRVQAVPTLFSFRDIDPTKTKVFPYPDDAGLWHSSVMSEMPLPNQSLADEKLSHYNARYGSNRQVHAYLIVFKNKGPDAGRNQESYWRGGGKNELVTTVGLDDSGYVKWAYVFSWSKDKMPSIVIRDSLTRMKKFDALQAVELIANEGIKKFTRREFKDFAYISVQPTTTAIVVTYLIVILLSGGWLFLTRLDYGFVPTQRLTRRRF